MAYEKMTYANTPFTGTICTFYVPAKRNPNTIPEGTKKLSQVANKLSTIELMEIILPFGSCITVLLLMEMIIHRDHQDRLGFLYGDLDISEKEPHAKHCFKLFYPESFFLY